jgi:hypothetical protein
VTPCPTPSSPRSSKCRRTRVNYARCGRYWTAASPGKTLRQITTGDIARYIPRRCDDRMAHATINKELAFLR